LILLFGASSGIGLALAQILRRQGQELTLLARDEARLATVAESLNCPYKVCDARDFAQVEAVFAEAEGLSGAVNCAGSILLKPAHLTSEKDYSECLDQNLKTAFAVVRAAGRSMKEGSVVLFSSAAASIGLPNHEAISAAKGAIEGLSRSAAATYAARGLRFNVIAPGLVDTPLAARFTSRPGARQTSEAQHPLGRLGQAEEVASLAAWLLSGEGSWATGQVFGLDGGLSRVKAAPRP